MSGLFEKAKAMINAGPPVPAGAPGGAPAGPPLPEEPTDLLPVESSPAEVPAQLTAGGEIVFDEDSGISKEDQKDILQEIEKAASENKLTAGPPSCCTPSARACSCRCW